MSFSNPGYSASLQQAIDWAWSQGVVLVAATGNDGSSTVNYPAGDRGVIGVGNTDSNDNLNPRDFFLDPAAFAVYPGIVQEVGEHPLEASSIGDDCRRIAGHGHQGLRSAGRDDRPDEHLHVEFGWLQPLGGSVEARNLHEVVDECA